MAMTVVQTSFFFFLMTESFEDVLFCRMSQFEGCLIFFMISLWIWILGGVYTGKMPFSLYPIKDIFYSIPYHS